MAKALGADNMVTTWGDLGVFWVCGEGRVDRTRFYDDSRDKS